MDYKVCRTCKQRKPISEFHEDRAAWEGKLEKCNSCITPPKVYKKREKVVRPAKTNATQPTTVLKPEKPKRFEAVYFVTDDEAIKIGKVCLTNDQFCKPLELVRGQIEQAVRNRITGLQIGNPRELKLIYYDRRLIEEVVHSQFKDIRIRGEWFRPEQSLYRFVEVHKGSAPKHWPEVDKYVYSNNL